MYKRQVQSHSVRLVASAVVVLVAFLLGDRSSVEQVVKLPPQQTSTRMEEKKTGAVMFAAMCRFGEERAA